jgi:hypothetical protein
MWQFSNGLSQQQRNLVLQRILMYGDATTIRVQSRVVVHLTACTPGSEPGSCPMPSTLSIAFKVEGSGSSRWGVSLLCDSFVGQDNDKHIVHGVGADVEGSYKC